MMLFRTHVLICSGTDCVDKGAQEIRLTLQEELKKHKLEDEVKVLQTGCQGFCEAGPIMIVYPEGIFYQKLCCKDIPYLTEEHFLKGRPVKKFFFKEPVTKEPLPKLSDIPFFSLQRLLVMRNRGIIDAESIEEYIARDGYAALAKVLSELTPHEVIEIIKASQLRGRGGAGFPTGLKWEETAKYNRFPKYVICNADEGDPGAFMDRCVLESDPHAVLEGMAICAYAIGAKEGYIYVRAEYPLAIKRLNIAIEQARSYNLLGENILNSGFSFDIQIYPGAGAFVCGESTALMFSLEGKRGMPRVKPPRSAEAGLWTQPTNLNNVETFANIPQIILRGPDWFKSIGTKNNYGTKVFSLTGAVNNVGLVEVPMGTSLRTLIYRIGEGIKGNRKFKAVQIGGPSGGCLPESLLDTPIDFESLEEHGAIMGSGGIVVLDDSSCMVDIARYFVNFCVDESCGKCTPCRVGLSVMLSILERITAGDGEPHDLEVLKDLGEEIINTAHCGLGQSAPNPVLSTLKHFEQEYKIHIEEKRCPAKVCVKLIKFEIDESLCKTCGVCAKLCPASAISWEKGKLPQINKDKCTKCKSCIKNCKFDAIY